MRDLMTKCKDQLWCHAWSNHEQRPTYLQLLLIICTCLQLPSKGAASAAVMGLGLVWAALGGSLLLATEYLQDTVSKYAATPSVMSQSSRITSGHMLISLPHML